MVVGSGALLGVWSECTDEDGNEPSRNANDPWLQSRESMNSPPPTAGKCQPARSAHSAPDAWTALSQPTAASFHR